MQLLQLGMMEEFDRVCRKHDIKYFISYGTLLGAVRHKGYIPWDDDGDICLLRNDYEKFREVAHELDSNICFFQDHTTDPAYRWGYAKIRRVNTVYIRQGQEHMSYHTGVCIDIFPLDGMPHSTAGMLFHDFRYFCLRKITYSEVGKCSVSEKAPVRMIYKALSRIPIDWVFKRAEKMGEEYRDDEDGLVRPWAYPSIGRDFPERPIRGQMGLPRKYLKERREYLFEGDLFWGPADYDSVLTYCYGDYMTPPPEDKRCPQVAVSYIDFSGALDALKQETERRANNVRDAQ